MNLSRFAAAAAGSVILVLAGGFVVQATTGDDTVTLCVNKTGAVTVPSGSGVCARGSTPIRLASDAAIDTLSDRVDALASQVSALGGQVSTLATASAAADAEHSSQISALAARIAALEGQDAPTLTLAVEPSGDGLSFQLVPRGANLLPGSGLTINEVGGTSSELTEKVAADGTISTVYSGLYQQCSLTGAVTAYTVTGTGQGGEPVTSAAVENPCGPPTLTLTAELGSGGTDFQLVPRGSNLLPSSGLVITVVGGSASELTEKVRFDGTISTVYSGLYQSCASSDGSAVYTVTGTGRDGEPITSASVANPCP